MFRASKLLEKLEDRLEKRLGKFFDRYGKKVKFYIPLAVTGIYFYGMFINSVKLGIRSVWGSEPVESIWVANPFLNFFAILTPEGLLITGTIVLLTCLITKKGYIFFSGYKFIHDERGFDILPDGTHGTASFMSKKEYPTRNVGKIGPIDEAEGVILGKFKDKPDDDDKYAEYVCFDYRAQSGLNGNILCVGAPGSFKTTGFIIPFLLECLKRRESVYLSDPKGELYAQLSTIFRNEGYVVKVLNTIDMDHSDSLNSICRMSDDPVEVQSISNTIIQNTSGPGETQDFWSRAEISLLEALIYYVSRLTKGNTSILLPPEQRSLGAVYRLLSSESIETINTLISGLPDDHPAHGPHGNFLKAKENLWGNIAIGLGNRLAVFQSKAVDQITSHDDIDLVLPGIQPCIYFCIVSAQDSTYRFLSSLFFAKGIMDLSLYAQKVDPNRTGMLPVTVNFCMDEYLNIGKLVGMSDALGSCRGFNINIQAVVQSLSQFKHRYPNDEWALQEGAFDLMLYMGCNDPFTAKFMEERCGKITISVLNNQMPMMPLFSPVLHSTRPYSQTRSNTQRELMQASEIMRLERDQLIAFIRGEKAVRLYKLKPGEHPLYKDIERTPIREYEPAWSNAEKAPAPTVQREAAQTPVIESAEAEPLPNYRPSPAVQQAQKDAVRQQTPKYTFVPPSTSPLPNQLGKTVVDSQAVHVAPLVKCTGNEENEKHQEDAKSLGEGSTSGAGVLAPKVRRRDPGEVDPHSLFERRE